MTSANDPGSAAPSVPPGSARPQTSQPARPHTPEGATLVADDAKPRKGYSEYGVAALLLALGVWAIVDAMGLTETATARGPVGPKTVPVAVGVLLIAMAVLLVIDVARGGRGEMEGGEDVDLAHGSDWRTIGLLAASFVANALLIERVGWPISGAILFFGSAYALGSRHYVRLAAISIALSVGTWYLFYAGLNIKLPPGLLNGIL